MTTQVVFRIDKKVKDKAMKRAKREGIPFAAVMKIAARAYAQERFHIDGTQEEKFNTKTAREIRAAIRDIEQGKNIISFKSTKEMDDYLLSR
ncbi:hypothetical protein A3A38_04535 [Candidatus Kaiserbacteria bacterium RIFCSPLOWO2_01_FULL_53_17]|uniref:Uncharacterized protein n=1 Tax=Candidatus Kaiserbacteria bacterium RIFCSPLOWO2_01_FULL_53_17 TaxID=1798511 RepID=A0A1F6EH61_9BACT|nr:MAG: hypothetical protein A3A38_04535 [Candidatus Kaiserbacteria bacterium RIFCSPLOWO2_01_FULL_53_17]